MEENKTAGTVALLVFWGVVVFTCGWLLGRQPVTYSMTTEAGVAYRLNRTTGQVVAIAGVNATEVNVP